MTPSPKPRYDRIVSLVLLVLIGLAVVFLIDRNPDILRARLGGDLPVNEGAFRPIRVIAPPGTVVNARPPAAVAAGNVETSQRIVDAVLES